MEEDSKFFDYDLSNGDFLPPLDEMLEDVEEQSDYSDLDIVTSFPDIPTKEV